MDMASPLSSTEKVTVENCEIWNLIYGKTSGLGYFSPLSCHNSDIYSKVKTLLTKYYSAWVSKLHMMWMTVKGTRSAVMLKKKEEEKRVNTAADLKLEHK